MPRRSATTYRIRRSRIKTALDQPRLLQAVDQAHQRDRPPYRGETRQAVPGSEPGSRSTHTNTDASDRLSGKPDLAGALNEPSPHQPCCIAPAGSLACDVPERVRCISRRSPVRCPPRPPRRADAGAATAGATADQDTDRSPASCKASAPATRAGRRRWRCPADGAAPTGAVPDASGSPPNNAHIVVIMIGRKRNRQASWIASSGLCPRRAPPPARSRSS